MNSIKFRYPSVLSIAGFDGSGGAGQQADIKTISSLGCYATCVLTGLPIQNTLGVQKIYPIPLAAIEDQIRAVMDDVPPQAIKIGMVHSADLVDVIVNTLSDYPKVPMVFDPVMVASSGDKLIKDEDINHIVEKLFPIADLITPNMDESAVLANMPVRNLEEMLAAGKEIRKLSKHNILLKGGHHSTDTLVSVLIDTKDQYHRFSNPRIETQNIHGSGCTLSSAIASYLARGKTLLQAVELAQNYVHQAILQARDVKTGAGSGPLNHFFAPEKLIKISQA